MKKKIFSLVLALLMTVTTVSAVAFAEDEVGTEGSVVVYYEDYESKTDNLNYPVDSTGDRYKRVDISGSLINTLVTNLTNNPDYANNLNAAYSGSDSVRYDPSEAGLFTYKAGKEYSFSVYFDGVNKNCDKPFVWLLTNGAGAGFEDSGSLLGYKGTALQTGTQWLNLTKFNAVPDDSNSYVKSISQSWSGDTPSTKVYTTPSNPHGYTNIKFGLKNNLETAKSPHVRLSFFQATILYNFLAESHAYCGSGMTNDAYKTKYYKWKLTADEVCKHMPAIADGTYTAESILEKEWNLSIDCTSLKCSDETCANNSGKRMLAAAKSADLHFATDDVLWSAKAYIFDNTVSIEGGSASVDVVVNPTKNAEKLETVKYENLVNGSSFTANNYFDPKFTITPESGKRVNAVTYNGQSLPAQYSEADGTYTVTISAASVVQNGVLDVSLVSETPKVSFTAAPVVTANENGEYVVEGKTYASPFTIIMYGKLSGAADSYGFIFNQLANDTTEGGTLKLYADRNTDGAFAIRVIGEGITAGSYTAWPYFTASGATTEEKADIQEITVE